jgi:hypothetical protein
VPRVRVVSAEKLIMLTVGIVILALFLWPIVAMSHTLRSLPRGIRHASRRRRGRCVGCGYELKGLAVCPECGGGA